MSRVIDLLDALEALEQQATSSPWERTFGPHRVIGIRPDGMSHAAVVNAADPEHCMTNADAFFMAALRNAAPGLLAALRSALNVRDATLNVNCDPDVWEDFDEAIAALTDAGRDAL